MTNFAIIIELLYTNPEMLCAVNERTEQMEKIITNRNCLILIFFWLLIFVPTAKLPRKSFAQ